MSKEIDQLISMIHFLVKREDEWVQENQEIVTCLHRSVFNELKPGRQYCQFTVVT